MLGSEEHRSFFCPQVMFHVKRALQKGVIRLIGSSVAGMVMALLPLVSLVVIMYFVVKLAIKHAVKELKDEGIL